MSAPILLIGAGRMGAALARGWIEDGRGPDITAIEPRPEAGFARALRKAGGRLNPKAASIGTPQAVVLAVKPQMLEDVARDAARFVGKPVFISIAAGIALKKLGGWLGERAAIVRAMPNLPAAIGQGATVAAANTRVTRPQKALAGALLAAAGALEWLNDETPIDAVTAVSGSGPAYVFLLVEALAAAGVGAGLKPDLAMRLAHSTVAGAGGLLAAWPDRPAETLRRDVTSPGGTTEAALKVLMGTGGMTPLLAKAVKAAVKRAKALGA
ncbi:Pyrroline-5-carboxylate reductase [Alphaproteobacteria bacterium SO-S41]|nr:Pyrroline-5-carboxylate reductase [Alphaproteobacteria bacterium SO-S41]